jgi:hypothetical protein
MRGVRAQLYDARSMSALHMACEVDRSDAVRDLLALPTLNVNIVNVRDADETAVYERSCNWCCVWGAGSTRDSSTHCCDAQQS